MVIFYSALIFYRKIILRNLWGHTPRYRDCIEIDQEGLMSITLDAHFTSASRTGLASLYRR